MNKNINEKEIYKSSVTDFGTFFRGTFSYGVIIRDDEEKIRELQAFLLSNDYNIAFDLISTEKLWIKKDSEL